ncbi:MAG: type IV pilus twitching motility protein PilT [Bacillota bacterium]
MLEVCRRAHEMHASDIHVTVESPPLVRVHGELCRLDSPPLSPKDTDRLLATICPPERLERFRSSGQVDFSYSVAGVGRFRVNAFRQRGSTAFVLRVLRSEVPRLEDLGLPAAVGALSRKRAGLVLVTGATGSGKSSTLAAIVNAINATAARHIITLEDPVEFLHRHQRSIVNQREIGNDTPSFAEGIRAALREDPDVIVLGELRDQETATTALSAAETGHLILATIHAPRVALAVNRFVDLFPLAYQQQARVQFSDVVEGIVAQQLLPRASSPGRVAACEVLVATLDVREAIRAGDGKQLYQCMRRNQSGMTTMEQSLSALYAQAAISIEEYKAHGAQAPGL